MYVSETTFLHLRQAEDERRSRELEYRRIAREREADTGSTTEGGFRVFLRSLRRSEYTPQRRLSHP